MAENWHHRIENFEQTPPQGVWENIAGKLDAENNLQSRLLNHEETPPPAVWENINSQLDGDKQEAKVIPIQSNKSRKLVWSMVAAASVVAIILVSVFYLNTNKPVDNSLVANTETKKDTPASSTVTNTPGAITEQQPVATAEVKPPAKKQSIRKKTIPAENVPEEIDIDYVKTDEVEPLAGPPEFDKNKKLANLNGEETNDIAMLNAPNTYITITGPNGDLVKISSKFANAINYINDKMPSSEEYIDKVIKEGKFWRGKFKAWRDKMINTTLTPNPNNFMDIIELSKIVKE